MNLEQQVRDIALKAREAGRLMARADSEKKNRALEILADLLEQKSGKILEANIKDVHEAENRGLDKARVERLKLDSGAVKSMAGACREVAAMHDPVGGIESMHRRPSGITVGRMRIPLGVVAIIYESRPNVTIDAAILCLKAGNAVILRGGSEAANSNEALAGFISMALAQSGLSENGVCSLPSTDREAVRIMLKQDDCIDVVIPRGGEGLIRAVVQDATMPVLKHYKGVCHIYVHNDADLDRALDIVQNAKVQRPGVCNALECLLVHSDVAGDFLPRLSYRLAGDQVEYRACEKSLPLLGDAAGPAAPDDFGREFLSLTMAVRVVDSQDQAQEHIDKFGSGHSEAILTRDYSSSMRFLREVDASAVFVNASTRFNDGGQFGLGAEIGISTSKLHAYGPMGVRELTSTKFVVLGEGQIRG
ncbi:glutamate-5-semialdehyde dehydrogenase [Desulfonatronospira sp.]|uniref:glutamate-5-semialdehyde dehydrogenase n=1 Tax=Desulfonatronospira sp. TaxID=1962951 RepID=UPI0025B90C2F|nr:glutamate-5-semialdehyde dehydrogenase [Desulfonatronospira sp.]